MIKLFNKTKYADKPLKDILTYAQRRLGVKGDVVVKVTGTRHSCSSGMAHDGTPYLWHLAVKRLHEKANRYETVGDSGWFEIRVSIESNRYMDLYSAESFFNVALHEMAHIKDYRNGQWLYLKQEERAMQTGKKRRMKHDRRPIELSAENHTYDARPHNKTQREMKDNLILNLAIEMEQMAKKAYLKTLVDKLIKIKRVGDDK